MNKNDLLKELCSIKNAKRVYRDRASNFVIQNPEVFPFLLELIFKNKTKTSIKAAWVFELVCFENLNLMVSHINLFTNKLRKITDESALRPIAKVCFFITKAFYINNEIKLKLTDENKDQIIEANFDWLIEDHKVATQAFAMDTLYLFGKESDWIHRELKLILEKNAGSGSAGYQAHARKILKDL